MARSSRKSRNLGVQAWLDGCSGRALMNKRIVNTLVLFLENVGAAIWVGALVTFGFAVAGTIFHEAPSITVAGNLNAKILAQLNRLEFSAAALMAIAAVY